MPTYLISIIKNRGYIICMHTQYTSFMCLEFECMPESVLCIELKKGFLNKLQYSYICTKTLKNQLIYDLHLLLLFMLQN